VTFKNNSGTVTKTIQYTYDAQNRQIRKILDKDGAGSQAADYFYLTYQGTSPYDQLEDPDGLRGRPTSRRRRIGTFNAPGWTRCSRTIRAWERSGCCRTTRGRSATWPCTCRTWGRATSPTGSSDAFGNITNVQSEHLIGTYDTLIGWGGGLLDADSGLQNNLNRWYDPLVGRFASEDPSGLGPDSNPYRYVGNNPLTNTDPTGLCVQTVADTVNSFSTLATSGASQLGSWFSNTWNGMVQNSRDRATLGEIYAAEFFHRHVHSSDDRRAPAARHAVDRRSRYEHRQLRVDQERFAKLRGRVDRPKHACAEQYPLCRINTQRALEH